MKLILDDDDGKDIRVDRTGTARLPRGREGFSIFLPGLELVFEDEDDAVQLARNILDREGKSHVCKDNVAAAVAVERERCAKIVESGCCPMKEQVFAPDVPDYEAWASIIRENPTP